MKIALIRNNDGDIVQAVHLPTEKSQQLVETAANAFDLSVEVIETISPRALGEIFQEEIDAADEAR